jgi:hypothetical protein
MRMLPVKSGAFTGFECSEAGTSASPSASRRVQSLSWDARTSSWVSHKPGSPSEQIKTLQGMAMNFLACDREQPFLMPPDPRDWLPEDHLAWFVLASVEEMDLSAFFAAYRRDGWGRAAFEPSMMA